MNQIVKGELIDQLAELVLGELDVDQAALWNTYSHRGAKARQVITLALLEIGVQPRVIADYFGLDPSFVSQVRTRNWKMKTTDAFHKAQEFLQQRIEKFNANA